MGITVKNNNADIQQLFNTQYFISVSQKKKVIGLEGTSLCDNMTLQSSTGLNSNDAHCCTKLTQTLKYKPVRYSCHLEKPKRKPAECCRAAASVLICPSHGPSQSLYSPQAHRSPAALRHDSSLAGASAFYSWGVSVCVRSVTVWFILDGTRCSR